MRKSIFSVLVLLLLLVQPLSAAAAPLETSRSCSLQIHYAKEGSAFAGIEARIYRVAEASADGTYDLIAPYSGFPVNIHGITSQQEWKSVASTLTAYIIGQRIQPDRTAVSGADGTASFWNLPTGLYLVLGNVAENDQGIYFFEDFLVYLPTPAEDGTFDYDMDDVRPKSGVFIPKAEYTVKKLWKDTGTGLKRPKSVTVDIYKDGILQETVTLNKDNDWCHTWAVTGEDGKWTVSERTVPSGYTVSISSRDSIFTITNTAKTAPDAPPKTGDTFPLWPYTIAMSLSGFLLLHVATQRKRRTV